MDVTTVVVVVVVVVGLRFTKSNEFPTQRCFFESFHTSPLG